MEGLVESEWSKNQLIPMPTLIGVRPEDVGPQYSWPGPFITGWHYTIDFTHRREAYHDSCFPGGDRSSVSGDYVALVPSCQYGGFFGYSLSGVFYPPDAFVALPGPIQTGGGLIGYRRT